MTNQLTRHQLFVQRYANGILRDILPYLKKIRNDISARMLNATPLETRRLSLLMADLNAIINDGIAEMKPSLFGNIQDFAAYEVAFTTNILQKEVVPSLLLGAGFTPDRLTSFLSKSKMTLKGYKKPMTIDNVIKVFSDGYKKEIKQEIQRGIIEGNTLNEITYAVEKLEDNRTRAQAQGLIRTITNHVGTVSRGTVWKANEHLLEGERFIATLDSKTSPICILNDGKIFKVGEGSIPPMHMGGCRSIRVPVIKEKYRIGERTTRAAAGGEAPASYTYNNWLKKQSIAVQNEVLGESRAKAYRKDGKKIERFIDNKGAYYTLAQLKKKDML